MEILKKITSSRKFWYAFGALCLLYFSSSIGIDPNNVVLIALGLIVSQGLADRTCKK